MRRHPAYLTIAADYQRGRTAAQVACDHGLTPAQVYYAARLAGVWKGRAGHRRPADSRLALLAAGHPAWVVRLGMTPCARAIVAALQAGPQDWSSLADRLHYASETMRVALLALGRLGLVRRIGRSRWGLA